MRSRRGCGRRSADRIAARQSPSGEMRQAASGSLGHGTSCRRRRRSTHPVQRVSSFVRRTGPGEARTSRARQATRPSSNASRWTRRPSGPVGSHAVALEACSCGHTPPSRDRRCESLGSPAGRRRRTPLTCRQAVGRGRPRRPSSARHHIAVVKHRTNVPCTNAPALTRAPVLCPKGDSCRRLWESVQATSRTDTHGPNVSGSRPTGAPGDGPGMRRRRHRGLRRPAAHPNGRVDCIIVG